jgi:hypothetical protein
LRRSDPSPPGSAYRALPRQLGPVRGYRPDRGAPAKPPPHLCNFLLNFQALLLKPNQCRRQ